MKLNKRNFYENLNKPVTSSRTKNSTTCVITARELSTESCSVDARGVNRTFSYAYIIYKLHECDVTDLSR